MIPRDNDRTVMTHGLGETVQFRIKPSGKAFRLLIDGLYSNKVRAVIRELWTNAYDSHVVAGNPDRPFRTTLPTPLDPTFRVRDYGVGMDHDTVMTLYSTIFESSKDSTNDQVGMMGLGSKSPFAYTDQFAVSAYDGETVRRYVAVIGSDGVPQISLIAEVACEEERGVEVSIAVRNTDYRRFEVEARDLLLGFDICPSGIEHIAVDSPLFAGDTWRVFANTSEYKVAVRQGCVVYPVHGSLANAAAVPYGYGLVIDVPIGSVDVTGSRESLSLDDQTTAVLLDRIRECSDEITAHIESVLGQQPSLVSATKLWHHRYRLFRSQVSYKGIALKPHLSIVPLGGSRAEYALRHARPSKTKGTHVVELNVDTIESMTLIVDDGERHLRKAQRIRTAGKGKRDVFVASQGEAARIAALLELRPEQLVPVDRLPDPGPAQRTSGPKQPSLDLPTGEFLWGLRCRSDYSVPELSDTEIKDTDDLYRVMVAALVDLGAGHSKVTFVTERQARQAHLSKDQRWDVVLRGLVAAQGPLLAAQAAQDAKVGLVSALHSAFPWRVREDVRRTIIEHYLDEADVVNEQRIVSEPVMRIARLLGLVEPAQTDARIRSLISTIRSEMPLLFTDESKLVEFYVHTQIQKEPVPA